MHHQPSMEDLEHLEKMILHPSIGGHASSRSLINQTSEDLSPLRFAIAGIHSGQSLTSSDFHAPFAFTSEEPNTTWAPLEEEPFCKWILYRPIGNSRARIWDVIILIPNALFLLFLLVRLNRAQSKLRAASSPIFYTFYSLVFTCAVISVVRCIVSLTVNAAVPAGDLADKILWIAVRFFLLSAELSVVIFGLAFGHLDSKTSIRRVLIFTSFISLAYSATQGALEIMNPDDSFHVEQEDYDIFGHGGMLFCFISSIVFSVVYGAIFLLPWTKLRDRLPLPSKRSFYAYVCFLALLSITQAVGSGLLNYNEACGLCMVDITTYVYFTFFTPLVYKAFLSEFFGVTQPNILFSYKAQVDEVIEDDDVSLPHQLSCSSLKTDSDYIYQNNSVYDSTQFDSATPVNPLYAHSLQSPDSIVGYNVSRSNSINSEPGFGYQQLHSAFSAPLGVENVK